VWFLTCFAFTAGLTVAVMPQFAFDAFGSGVFTDELGEFATENTIGNVVVFFHFGTHD